MQKIKTNNKNIKNQKAFYFLTFFILIAFSSETVLWGTNNEQKIRNIGYMIFAVLVVSWIIYAFAFNIQIQKSTIFLAFLFIILSSVTALINLDLDIKYIYELLLIVSACLVCQAISLDRFQSYYVSIIYLLSIFSLIALIVNELYFPIIEQFPIIKNKAGGEFYNLFFCVIPKTNGFRRNYGIFREPGVFAVYLMIALIFELLNTKKTNFFKVSIFIIALLTTYSTAGYISLGILLMAYLCMKSKQENRKIKAYIAIMILVCLFFLIYNKSLERVFNKLSFDNDSRNARFGAMRINIHLLLIEPWKVTFGQGFTRVEELFPIIAKQLEVGSIHNPNTFFKILSVHGIVYFFTVLYMLYNFFRKSMENVLKAIIAFLVVLLIFSNEDFIVNSLIYLLIFYARQPIREENNENF